jgi:hypothetical protein
MEKSKRSSRSKRPSSVCVCKRAGLKEWTQQVIEVMMELGTFDKNTIFEKTNNNKNISLRRINDVVAILTGAGFVKKSVSKVKHYTFVGIEGTRRLYDSFKKNNATRFFGDETRRSQYYGWRLVQLLASKNKWDDARELRAQVCSDIDDFHGRRAYDIVSVFLGAGLIHKTKNKCIISNIQTIQKTIFEESSRVSLVVSNEDAIRIFGSELEQHLNKEIFIF